MPGDPEEQDKAHLEQEMFQIFLEIALALNTGLDAVSLKYCMRLCESGVSPESIAKIIVDMRNDVKAFKERKLETKGAAAKES